MPSGVLQLDLSPEFRTAVSWLYGLCFFGGFFCLFFCDGGVFIVLFGGLGCVVLVYFERDWLLIMNFKKM